MRDYLQVFSNRRVALMMVLGFASGLPLALTTGTLQAWATVEGVDIRTIGMLTLVGSAYTLKFLWAPLMDRFVPPLLGRRRGWMLVTQLALAVAIAVMGTGSPGEGMAALAAIAVLVAFVSASQDIAFDAYRTDVLRAAERGAGAAMSVFGYRLAMLVSGGLALVLAGTVLGWRATYFLMAALMGIGALATLLAPEPDAVLKPPRTLQEAVVGPWRDFFSRSFGAAGAGEMLALIVLYKLSDAFALSLSTAFLIRGAGFSVEEVGYVNKGLGLVATILGAMVGGGLMARLGLFRSLMLFGVLQTVSNLAFWALAVTPRNIYSMAAAVAVENICGGMGTTAFVALLMALCNRRYSATQFALLSSLSAVGRTYVAGPLSGAIVAQMGWPAFFAATVVIGMPGLWLLWRRREVVAALDAQPAGGT